MEAGRPSSLSCAHKRIRPTMMRLIELLSCTKGCPDGWFGYIHLKLKLDKNSSNYLVREKIGLCMRMYLACAFWKGFYRAEESFTIVLIEHFDFLL